MAAYTNEELLARIEELERRLAQHPNDTRPAADSPGADIWFLLDRSGSMASIATDVVRGFVALASMQASARPELKQLASAINVTTEASRVHVAARVPYEVLDSLQPKRAASAPPTAQ